MIVVFNQNLKALAGEVFSADFIRWLRDASRQVNDVVDTASVLVNVAALSVIGNPTNAAADASAITAGSDGFVLRRSGTTLGFGTVATAGIASNAVTLAKLATQAALTVLANATNGAAVPSAVAAGSDGQVFLRSGTALQFGTVATAGVTDNAITLAKLATQAALTVLANATNGAAVPTAVAAASDGQVFLRSGTALQFGTVATAGIANSAVTYAKVQNVAGLSVVGRSANSSGVAADITGADGDVLRVSGTTLGFGSIVAAGIAAAAVTYAKIQNIAGLSVMGRSTNSSGVGADITGTDGQALRVSGTSLGFGTLASAAYAAASVTYAAIQNVAGLSVMGRSANSSGVAADITGTNGQILRVSGTTLGFGKILTNFITGTATNDSAAAGDIGEVASASATGVASWTAGTPQNIVSVSLTAGDWDVSGSVVWYGAAGVTATAPIVTAVTATSASIGSRNDVGRIDAPANLALSTTAFQSYATPTLRVSLSGTTTVYIVGQVAATAANLRADGQIHARRPR